MVNEIDRVEVYETDEFTLNSNAFSVVLIYVRDSKLFIIV